MVFLHTTCTALAAYESVGGDWLFGHKASVYVAVASLALACCFRHLLVGTGHTSCSSCMCVFLRGGMHSYHPFFFPRCWRPLCASSSPSLGPGVICCGLVPCRVWEGRGWRFLCVCVRAVGGVLRIPLLPCSIPSPPWLPVPFLLVHALAVLPLAAALGGLVFHTWLVVACGSLRAFVHVLSSPVSFSLLAPSYIFASPRRLFLRVCIRLHCIPCFACGGLYE